VLCANIGSRAKPREIFPSIRANFPIPRAFLAEIPLRRAKPPSARELLRLDLRRNIMKSHASSKLSIVVLGVCATSCAYAVPYRSSGPSFSKEGVEIAIAGERCFVNRSGEQFPTTVNDDQLNLDLRLQVKNDSKHIAVLSPDRVLLSEAVGGERTVMRPLESGAISFQPGESKLVSLDFEQSGALDCHHELTLDAVGVIKIEGGQVKIEPIRFLASD
jgi:hypothetical protein